MGGLIGLTHNGLFPNWHHVKEYWIRGMFLTKKLHQIYELRDRLLKGKFLHAQLCYFENFWEELGQGPGFFSISPLRTIMQVYNEIWVLSDWIVADEKQKGKNNTRINSTKGEQVRKVVMWHWRIVMSKRNGWFMLHFKNFWLLKSPTVRRNCKEITDINNEEIMYILLNIFKSRYNTKETNK